MQGPALRKTPVRSLAAGEDHLAAGDAPQDEILPPGVQLREHIVQEQDGPLAGVVPKQLPLGQLQRQRSGPGLPLGGILPGRLAVDLGHQVVFVGAGETGPGVPLGLGVAVLVAAEVLVELHCGAQRVPDRGDGGVVQGQCLPSPGKFGLNLGGLLRQLADEVGPVVDHQRPGPGHGLVEVLQHIQ